MASEAQTVVLAGNGTQAATFQLAPNVYEKIQSVLVEVDTSASGDVSPTLTVFDQDTTPVADKQQGRAISGGGSGRATWALRLDDELSVFPASLACAYGMYSRTFPNPLPTIAPGGTQNIDFNFFFHNNAPAVFTPQISLRGFVFGVQAIPGTYAAWGAVSWVNSAFQKNMDLLLPGPPSPDYVNLAFASGSSSSATAPLVWSLSLVDEPSAWGTTNLRAHNGGGVNQAVSIAYFCIVKLA